MSSSTAASNRSSVPTVPHSMVTTAFTLDGYRIVRNLGLVRGIIVRSRSIVGTIGAGLQTLIGGNITLLTNLVRADARARFRPDAAACGRTRRQCGHRHALRCDRSHAGSDRSAGLRNGRLRGEGIARQFRRWD